VERILVDRAANLSIGRMRISPLDGDAGIHVIGSRDVELHNLFVTAQGTARSASVRIPDSQHVAIRDRIRALPFRLPRRRDAVGFPHGVDARVVPGAVERVALDGSMPS
jgi:hypothetical protein